MKMQYKVYILKFIYTLFKIKDRLDNNLISLLSILFISALLLYWNIYFCKFCFDFTDEGYYLINIDSPSLDYYEIRNFGYIYHIFYNLLGKEIFLLRVSQIIVTFILSFLLVFLLIKDIFKNCEKKYLLFLLPFCISSISLTYTQHASLLLITPSYNTLNFQSLLVFMVGIVILINKSELYNINLQNFIGCVIIGIGCTLCFLAKPSSAIMQIGCTVIFIILHYFRLSLKKEFKIELIVNILLLLIVIACTFLICMTIFAYMAGSNLYDLSDRYREGYITIKILEAGHSLKEAIVGFLRVPKINKLCFFVIYNGVIYFLLAYLCQKSKKSSLLFALTTCFCYLVIMLFSYHIPLSRPDAYILIEVLGVSLFVFLFAFLIEARTMLYNVSNNSLLSLLFFSMPLVYAFGTNGIYYRKYDQVIIFIFLGFIVLLRSLNYINFLKLALPYTLIVLFIITQVFINAQRTPYRQNVNIKDQKTSLAIGGGRLNVSREFAEYVNNAREKSKKGGFAPGMPIVDLTGQSPGLLYALQAEAVGGAWLAGGYPGSLAFVTRSLQHVSREKLQQSWLLLEPNGPRSIPDQIFQNLELNFPDDYEKKAEWKIADGAGGYKKGSRTIQQLYKPKYFRKLHKIGERSIQGQSIRQPVPGDERADIKEPGKKMGCEK